MSPTSIETMTGRFVDLVNPDPTTICLEDISWSLSRMPRYVAHTLSELPYTIGQHSIEVATYIELLFNPADCPVGLYRSLEDYLQAKVDVGLRYAILKLVEERRIDVAAVMEGLVHDMSEAFIVDVPTPLKHSPGFKEVYMQHEERMTTAIRLALGLPPTVDPIHQVLVSWADAVALTVEAHHLIRSRGANWTRLLKLDMETLNLFRQPAHPVDVHRQFMQGYDNLNKALSAAPQ